MMRTEAPRLTEFGILLTESRKRHGYTMEVLADLAGISPGYISLLETNKRNPTERVIRRLCGALDILPSTLLVSARIYAFDLSSTLRPKSETSKEPETEFTFSLTESERTHVELYVEFIKYHAAVDSMRAPT